MKELFHVWASRAIIFGIGSVAGAVFMWFYPSRKEWTAREKSESGKEH